MPLHLPNNCRLSKINVKPKNWDKSNARLSDQWEISYRFYDDNLKEEKPFRIRKVNSFPTIHKRQDFVRRSLKEIEDLYINQKFNPITGEYGAQAAPDFIALKKLEIKRITIIDALQYAYNKLNATKSYKSVTKSMLKDFAATIEKYNLQNTLASDFDELYIKNVLELTGKEKIKQRAEMSPDQRRKLRGEPWNNNRYNHYRALLNSLLLILEDEKIIPRNFIKTVKMLKKTEPHRQVISDDEIEILNQTQLPYEYERWLAIYKPSNRRATEFVKIKKEDVNLKTGKVKVEMMKGRSVTYPEFTIQDDILHLWAELYTQAKPGQYLFCKGLKPGDGMHIAASQIYRRWKRHVKDKTEIKSDQYTLKHKNLDELAALENIEFAQKAAGHSSAAITEKHYAKGESERRHEKLKKVSNKLFKEKEQYPHLRIAK